MAITDEQRQALAGTLTIDLTTIGRRSGAPRTVEIWWFHIDNRFVITGTPSPRDWLANVRSNPDIEISVGKTRLTATAVEITDPIFRRRVFTDPRISWYATQEALDDLVASAPMIEVKFD
jgi:deazaflavin-dependent oxidoreductase (nitroreductase family)